MKTRHCDPTEWGKQANIHANYFSLMLGCFSATGFAMTSKIKKGSFVGALLNMAVCVAVTS